MQGKETAPTWGAKIERAKITKAENGIYSLESYDRPGIKAEGIASLLSERVFSAGDKVYCFLFRDGKGVILCEME